MSDTVYPVSTLSKALLPGDVVGVRGTGWLSRRILGCSRGKGEPPTVLSHVGIVDRRGTLRSAEVLEAAGGKVRRTTLPDAYEGCNSGLVILRPLEMTPEDLCLILSTARGYEGRRYGFGDLPLHLIDALLFGGHYVARRMSGGSRPICSFLVAEAYKAVGQGFNVEAKAAQPDDIWDYAITRPGRWSRPLGRMPRRLPVEGFTS